MLLFDGDSVHDWTSDNCRSVIGRIYRILHHLRVVSNARFRLYLLCSQILFGTPCSERCDLGRVCYFWPVSKLDLLDLNSFAHVWRRLAKSTRPQGRISSAVAYDTTQLTLLALLSLSSSDCPLTEQLCLVDLSLLCCCLFQTFVDAFNLAGHL